MAVKKAPAKKRAPRKKAAPRVGKTQLLNRMMPRLEGFTRSEVIACINVLGEEVAEALAEGNSVTVWGLASFRMKETPARPAGMYPNPFDKDEDGKPKMVKRAAKPAGKKVTLRATKELKERSGASVTTRARKKK